MKRYGLLETEEVNEIIANSDNEIEASDAASSASAGAAAVGCAVAASFAA